MKEIKKIALEIESLNTKELIGETLINIIDNNKKEVMRIKNEIIKYSKWIDILKTKTYKKFAEVARAKEILWHFDICLQYINSYKELKPKMDQWEKDYNERNLN